MSYVLLSEEEIKYWKLFCKGIGQDYIFFSHFFLDMQENDSSSTSFLRKGISSV